MASSKEINSTERLLRVIRESQQPSSEATQTQQPSARQKKTKSGNISFRFPDLFSGRRKLRVGVDITSEHILLAKMTASSDGRPLLLERKIIKIDTRVPVDSNEYRNFLKTSLSDFAGARQDCEIWALMDAADANVHYLKIPIVPKNQLENAIYWSAKKENQFDENETVFDYELQGQVIDQGIPKYSVMVCSVPRVEVEKTKARFASTGVDLAGITIAPFALQNLFRAKWISFPEPVFASLYIGNDFSRIDIFSNNNLVMTRGIKTGITSMLEGVNEALSETSPGRSSRDADVRKILEEVLQAPGSSLRDEEGLPWNEKTVMEMISPALERLVRQIERTLEHYEKSIGYAKVEKLYISSVLNVFFASLLGYIHEHLHLEAQLLDPFEGSQTADELGDAEKSALVPAIGLALSDTKITPNAIFTYIEKNKEMLSKRISRGIMAFLAAVLGVCLVIFTLQAIEYRHLGARQQKLERELSIFTPVLSRDTISSLTEELRLRHMENKSYALKYGGLGLISELASLTPDNISLVSVQISMPKQTDKGYKGTSTIIEGVVMAERDAQDASLAQFIMKLKNSPVFKDAALQKSNIVNFRKKEILQFTVRAGAGR